MLTSAQKAVFKKDESLQSEIYRLTDLIDAFKSKGRIDFGIASCSTTSLYPHDSAKTKEPIFIAVMSILKAERKKCQEQQAALILKGT